MTATTIAARSKSAPYLAGGLLLALCIGIVNVFLLPAEIGNMYAQEGLEKPVTGLTGFWNLIPLVGWIIWIVKVQDAMNDRWEASGGTHV